MRKAQRDNLRLGSLLSLGLLAFAMTGAALADEQGTAATETKAAKAQEGGGKFVHLFYFKFKEGVADEEIAELMKELANSTKKIPVVKEFMVGKNVARNSHGFQYGEIAVFDKEEDHHVFQLHPEHRKLVPRILPYVEMGITMDFEPIEY